LLDGIEAVDDLFVAELNELSDAITDRLTARVAVSRPRTAARSPSTSMVFA
jgi:hypothetical protein